MLQHRDSALIQLESNGQSVWLDHIRRDLLDDGSLRRMIDEDGVSGLTSNPAIFERAIKSGVYKEAIANCREAGLSPEATLERLELEDIRQAAEILSPVYQASRKVDGYVSLEVPPALADDAEASCAAARRIWSLVEHPNLMIKIPATSAGIQAIRVLVGEGINVNATLLFSRHVYAEVAAAYLAGLEHWQSQGGDLSKLASVASFFVSRIDTAIDRLIQERLANAEQRDRNSLESLLGKTAIASAKLAYQDYLSTRDSTRWQTLQQAGANPQRLLWASTSTKNPAYRDVLYVEELIGPETVTTVPLETLASFRDHGIARSSLTESPNEAAEVLQSLSAHDISLEAVTQQLTRDGVELFGRANDRLLSILASNDSQHEASQ